MYLNQVITIALPGRTLCGKCDRIAVEGDNVIFMLNDSKRYAADYEYFTENVILNGDTSTGSDGDIFYRDH
jgi:uncharacterized 2Fe-2S/4Fe-4S cluster protein (DUF4445 family)